MVDAGSQNAGAVDIGNGLAAVFKIESHNHPSAVEPVQGAATGVGGIVRDILAMGAKPIALMNSLRFGDMSLKNDIHIFNGVVSGISEYGNCIGIPNVGGEIVFDESYNNNPLVNAFCLGIVKHDEIVEAKKNWSFSSEIFQSHSDKRGSVLIIKKLKLKTWQK